MGATVEDVSGKLIISKFPNRQCLNLAKKSSGLFNLFRASKICLLPALWACDLKNFLRRLFHMPRVLQKPAGDLLIHSPDTLTEENDNYWNLST